MKILLCTQLYPPLLYGGGEYIFSKWAQELARRGHEVSVITQRIEGTKRFEKKGGIKIYRVEPKLSYSGALYTIGLRKNLGFLFSCFNKILKIGKDYDIIHSNTFVPAIAGQYASRILKKPHIITIHDVYLQQDKKFWSQWAEQRKINPLIKIMGPFLEKSVLRLNPNLIHTVSETSKNDLISCKIPEQKIRIIPNGIDLKEYEIPKASKKAGQFCYIGRLVFYKNLETVIRAIKTINCRFLIAGVGPDEERLKKLAKELGIEKKVIFLGRISNNEKIKLLKESRFLVQPSVIEGFGITIIEAFACKTPVISSNVMPLPELVKDNLNGFTVPAFGIQEWKKTIKIMLKSPNLCKKLGNNSYKFVKDNYSIEKVVDKLESLYEELINESKGNSKEIARY